jgi:hypothetical protein
MRVANFWDHNASGLSCRPREGGDPVFQSVCWAALYLIGALDYWVARSSRAMTSVHVGPDGYPRPPESVLTRHSRGFAAFSEWTSEADEKAYGGL